MKNPTLREIAKVAGVSHVTVSLALRNDPRFSAATRKNIQKIAAKMGYQADPVVSMLTARLRVGKRERQRETLAFITTSPTEQGWKSVENLSFFEGSRDQAQKRGYSLDVFWAKAPGLTARRMSSILYARGIRGLILAPLHREVGHLPLEWKKFAAVGISTLMLPRIHSVRTNDLHSITQVIRQLVHRQYSKIGLALQLNSHRYAQDVFRAHFKLYQSSLPNEKNIPVFLNDLIDHHHHDKDFKLYENEFIQWYEKWQPDALITMGPWIPRWLEKMKKKAPKDVGLVNLDLTYSEGMWTGMHTHARHVAAAAVDFLMEQLNHGEFGIPIYPRQILVDGTWFEGKTLRQRSKIKR
jgi:LacI family transcriptional regulator